MAQEPSMNPDWITLEIDGRTVSARKGMMLIEIDDPAVARIPRFCYHRKLSVAANCRMCLVEVEKAPKPLPACATPVMPGMKVFTRSPLALAAQQGTMEFLLINHPLDCPICDQGGECELQDVAVGYGASASRFVEDKRVVADQDIGPLIATEMTRCIHCTRCVRFGAEIAGVRELGATGRGEAMQIGTFVEHALTHELSGNVIDLCPVGALTAKPSRYQARAWEYLQAPTVAMHDAIGSNLYAHVHQGRVMRVVPRDNDAINETWIADRDRFSYTALRAADRLEQPMLRVAGQWQVVSWETALAEVAAILQRHAPSRIGAVLSPSLPLEEYVLAEQVLRGLGVVDIDHRPGQCETTPVHEAPLIPWLGMDLAAVDSLQAALLVGCDPRREAPLLAHRLRKAALRGAQVSAIGLTALDLTYPLHAEMSGDPWQQALTLAALIQALPPTAHPVPAGLQALLEVLPELEESHHAAALRMAQALRVSGPRLIVLGAQAAGNPGYAWLQALTAWVAAASGATLGYLAPGANAAGAWLAGCVPGRGPAGTLAAPGVPTRTLLEEGREVILLAGVEPGRDFADPLHARQALERATAVVALASFRDPDLLALADVLLPVATSFETAGTFINAEGRWQSFHAMVPPPGEARPAWKVWRVLGNRLSLPGMEYLDTRAVRDALRARVPNAPLSNAWTREASDPWPPLSHLPRVRPEPPADAHIPGQTSGQTSGPLLHLVMPGLYTCDPLVRRAQPLQSTPEGLTCAAVRVHPESAGALANGVSVRLSQGEGAAGVFTLLLDSRVPPGIALTVAGASAAATLGAPGSWVSLLTVAEG
jgi:NADH-quinone oxidoreductase subunit G